jgi:hypothetical protein
LLLMRKKCHNENNDKTGTKSDHFAACLDKFTCFSTYH